MNQSLKNIILAIGGIVGLALAFSAVSYVNTYGKSIEPSSFRSFSVTADGRAVSVPDLAEFSFTVITEGGQDLTALQGKNTEAANKVIDFVKAQGVDKKDIRTLYYNVDPRYQSYECYEGVAPYSTPDEEEPIFYEERSASGGAGVSGSAGVAVGSPARPSSDIQPITKICPPASIVGYTITQSVDVKIRDFKKISDIMGGVVTQGANQVGSLSFTVDDPTAVQDEARAEAMAKAKVKAEAMAKAGGFRLGRLLGIQEGGGYYPIYDRAYSVGAYKEEASAAPAPSIEPGSNETAVSITMTYEIR